MSIAAKRDADKIREILKEVNGQLITTKGCKVIIPVRWETVGLASVGSETNFYGLFQITNLEGSYYAIHNVMATVHSAPDNIETFKGDDEEPYYCFTYEPGSVVLTSTSLMNDSELVGLVYKEFVKRGKVPEYVSYADMNNVFETSKEYAGVSIGDSFEILSVPISIIARNPNDINQYYREICNEVDMSVVKPIYVPAGSVNYSASSTLTKLTGSYFHAGVVSAINNPTENTEAIDHVLRY